MQYKFKLISMKSSVFLLLFLFIFYSCDKKYNFKWDTPDEISINQKLKINLIEENNQKIDKIIFTMDGKEIKDVSAIDISSERLGKHAIGAEIFYHSKSKKRTKIITFLAPKSPQIYDFKVVNTFPHATDAYTQGLEYHNGFLYESTGGNGKSSLRKVELKTGKVLQKIDLPSQYFAEGMTLIDDKIFQLTWQNDIGFIYNLDDFTQLNTFNYQNSKEGWGLTHDSNYLIKTDGTDKVWFLDPKTQKEIRYIEAYTNTQSVKDLNELEYINGKIYANVYQKNIILILNPQNGAIEGIADLNALEQEVKKTQDLIKNDEVLNGIAYDKENNRIFVTGKRWGKLFEVQFFERK